MAREDAEEAYRIARRPFPADAPEDARRPWVLRALARMAAFGSDV